MTLMGVCLNQELSTVYFCPKDIWQSLEALWHFIWEGLDAGGIAVDG